MTGPNLSRFVSTILAAVLPLSTLLAQVNSSAVLNANGGVMVNSTSVQTSAPVYEADVVKTGDGNAVISLPGSNLAVSSNSQIIYRAKTLDLRDGEVVVSTKTGMGTQAAQVVTRPAHTAATRYEVSIGCDSVTVYALLSDVVVTVGDRVYNMAEGATREFADVHLGDRRHCVAPVAPLHSSMMPLWGWIAIGAGAAGGGIALLGGGGSSHKSVSPSQP